MPHGLVPFFALRLLCVSVDFSCTHKSPLLVPCLSIYLCTPTTPCTGNRPLHKRQYQAMRYSLIVGSNWPLQLDVSARYARELLGELFYERSVLADRSGRCWGHNLGHTWRLEWQQLGNRGWQFNLFTGDFGDRPFFFWLFNSSTFLLRIFSVTIFNISFHCGQR